MNEALPVPEPIEIAETLEEKLLKDGWVKAEFTTPGGHIFTVPPEIIIKGEYFTQIEIKRQIFLKSGRVFLENHQVIHHKNENFGKEGQRPLWWQVSTRS